MLGISNLNVTRIRYVFVLELACYRVCYIRDNVKYLYCIKIKHRNLSLYNFLHHAYKRKIKIPFNAFFLKCCDVIRNKSIFLLPFQISACDYPFLRKNTSKFKASYSFGLPNEMQVM